MLECPIVVIANSYAHHHQKKPSIFWYYNSIPISSHSSSRIKQQPDGDLVIYNLRYTDAGTYTCRSTYNASVSHSIHVSVTDPKAFELDEPMSSALTLSDQPENERLTDQRAAPTFVDEAGMRDHRLQLVPSSGTAHFNCSARGLPLPTTEWFHNGQRINLNEQNSRARRNDLYDQSISFNDINTHDAGNFMCVVRNEFGTLNYTFRVRVTCE